MIQIESCNLSKDKYLEYERLTRFTRYGVNLHPTWLATYIETFGHQEVILEARESETGELCGLLPLARKDINNGRLRTLRRFVPLGYRPTDFFNILAQPGREDEVTAAIAYWLKSNKHVWDQVMLNLVPYESTCWRPFVKHLTSLGFHPDVSTEHAFLKIDTTTPYDDYLEKLGTKKQKKIRYYRNKISKAGELRIEHCARDLETFLDSFIDCYRRRRSQVSQMDPFSNLLPLYDFLKKIIPEYERNDWIRLSMLKLDQTVVAHTYQLIYNHIAFYYMPTFDDEFSAYSPGQVLLAELIKKAFEDPDIHEFNFMRSIHSYKLWYQPTRESYVQMVINNPWSYRIKVQPLLSRLSKAKHSALSMEAGFTKACFE